MTFVTPSRTTQPSRASAPAGTGGPSCRTSARDARVGQRGAGRLELARQAPAAVAGDRLAHLAERRAADLLDVRGLLLRPAPGPGPTSFLATCAFTTITDRVCPSRSCMSRAKRSRSASTADRASSSLVLRSSATASMKR